MTWRAGLWLVQLTNQLWTGPVLVTSAGCRGTAALLSSNTPHRALYFSNTLTKTSSILSGLKIPLELELVKVEAGAGDKCSVSPEVTAGGCLGSGQSCSFSPAPPPPSPQQQHSAQLSLAINMRHSRKQHTDNLAFYVGGSIAFNFSTVSIQWHSTVTLYNRRYAMPPSTTWLVFWCSRQKLKRFCWTKNVFQEKYLWI